MSASLAVTLYVLIVTVPFFLLPFKKEFTGNPIADVIIKRGSLIVGLFLMTLNTGIVATVTETAGINVSHDLLNVYLVLFGWGGYVAMFVLLVSTLRQIFKDWYAYKQHRRMGDLEQ